MITIKEQEILFLDISRKLKRTIICYAIGGTAMMFLGLKTNTRDIDLIFETEEERKIFSRALEELEFRKLDSIMLYGKKPNQPELMQRGEERMDLFTTQVISFIFSEDSKKRAKKTHQFGENLIIKIADMHDIILMKHATDRLKDLEDVRSIINKENINWNIILEEAKNQKRLGKERAIFDLGYFLEKLEEQFKIIIPKKITDEIWNLVEMESKEKRKKKKVTL